MLVQILILIETQKAWKPLHFIVDERKIGTDSLNVSANIDIDILFGGSIKPTYSP